jgi:cytochrome c556
MRLTPTLALAAILSLTGVFAQAQEDPFADAVETRHGLMLQMSADLATIGAMVKGEADFDAALAAKAAANIAAIASVISMDQFPAGSENGKAGDSFAKAELWANEQDFLSKVADLNAAAANLQGATGDLEALKGGMGALGKACAACHSTYRMEEN